MEIIPLDVGPTPPLGPAWRSTESVATAVVSGGTIYGVATDGSTVALRTDTGARRWKTDPKYLSERITVDGPKVYVFESGKGLIALTDLGASFSEQTLLEIGSLDQTTVSQPAVLSGLVHFVKGTTLMAVNTTSGGVTYQLDLGDAGPYCLYSLDGDLLAVSGTGGPRRLRPAAGGYTTLWSAPSTDGEKAERPAALSANYVVVGNAEGIAAYSKSTGSRIWSRNGVGNLALTVQGNYVYAAGTQAALWSLNLADGSTVWDRKYLAMASGIRRIGLATGTSHIWVGVLLDDGAEPAALWAVNLSDGSFAWQATSVTLAYGNGLPLAVEGRMYTYGSSEAVTAMDNLPSAPAVRLDHINQVPNPLRGAMSGFNPVEVALRLSVPAKVSFIAWHERDERNNPLGPIEYLPGFHFINYDARWPRGWTDYNQFGRLVFEIEETNSGLKYSQVLLVPVNTLPDIHNHWAKRNIEIMIYHKFIGGYPDLTFRPDNLITRGESSTIIAKTLGLERPSSGFRSKLTDIADHWARNYIMALEERGVIGGFREPDGTFTFRPNLNMTRAEEARILMRAYTIGAAPDGFQTRFTDIAGHWAEADIKALESRGYVTGFREANGTYTYRPEQNLTRAELCTVVVRVKNLTR